MNDIRTSLDRSVSVMLLVFLFGIAFGSLTMHYYDGYLLQRAQKVKRVIISDIPYDLSPMTVFVQTEQAAVKEPKEQKEPKPSKAKGIK